MNFILLYLELNKKTKIFKALIFVTLFVILITSFINCNSSKEIKDVEQTKHVQNKEQDNDGKHDGHDHSANSNKATHVKATNKIGKKTPLFIRDAYFERGTTGINIYFPTLINKDNFKLEKVYFRGVIGEMLSGKASYFAILNTTKGDLIMSNEPNAEFGNTLPTKPKPFPFKLKENECMISYIDGGEKKYFQVYNIIEKKQL